MEKQRLITKEILKTHNPCAAGYIEVLEKYGNNFEVTFEQFIKDFPHHKDWIQTNLGAYALAVHPDYKGKFKVGQKIYRQSYGIGSYTTSIIYKIDQHNDKIHYGMMVTAHRLGEYNWVAEEQIFETFEDLKAYWIKNIINLQEIKIKEA